MPYDFIHSTLTGAVVGVSTDAISSIYADTASLVTLTGTPTFIAAGVVSSSNTGSFSGITGVISLATGISGSSTPLGGHKKIYIVNGLIVSSSV